LQRWRSNSVPIRRSSRNQFADASLPVSCFAMGTDTGLAINERFQILRDDKQPIPGLFGAGTVALGGLMASSRLGVYLGSSCRAQCRAPCQHCRRRAEKIARVAPRSARPIPW